MKIRILSITCVVGAAALLAACTAVYKNTDACEQLMRSKLAETSPDTLKITHAGAGIHGARVVVEGSIEHVGAPASAPSAASAPLAASAVAVGASGARAASAVAVGASGARAASAVAVGASGARAASAVAVGASGARAASAVAVGASAASGAANASATAGASAASATAALSLKPAKPRKTVTPAAAECTFHGPTLNIFSWLAPANLVTPATNATE